LNHAYWEYNPLSHIVSFDVQEKRLCILAEGRIRGLSCINYHADLKGAYLGTANLDALITPNQIKSARSPDDIP
jgi:hypothetical protein